ncbi:MAG TPA: FtsX-like permease family protein [Candidatus Binatia bacterium]|nr:FtsX-like permease family protein [Candidatus Binatia bacterium]
MTGLLGYALRGLLARPLRSALTTVGVALGVGVLLATLAVNASVETGVDRTVRDVFGRAELRISGLRGRGLSDESLAAVAAAPGVAVAAPTIEQRTYLGPRPGTGRGGLPASVTLLGIDPERDPLVRDWPLSAGTDLAAAAATGDAVALVSEALAAADGLRVGDSISILGSPEAPPEAGRVRIVGILAGPGPVVDGFGRIVVVPIERARAIFGRSGADRVDVVVEAGVHPEAVRKELAGRLTTEPYVVASPADLAEGLRASTVDVRSMTALLAALALFVAAFLIFNTLSMTLVERVRELGLLRAAGASRRQIGRIVLVQAIVLGAVGSLLGLAWGVGLGQIVVAWVRALTPVRLETLDLEPAGGAAAAAVGLLVTVVAGLEPALRAGSVSPMEALAARGRPSLGPARLRWLVAVFGVVAVVAWLLWPTGPFDPDALRALLVYALLLVVTLVSPLLLGPLGRLAGLPFAVAVRLEERLARVALLRDRSRTAVTAGALMVGLAMIVALGVVAADARRAAAAWIEGVVPGDIVLTSVRPVGLDEPAVEELRSLPAVARLTPIASFDVAAFGYRLDAAAVVGADLLADGRLRVVAGPERAEALPAIDAGPAVLVPAAVADRLGLRPGSDLPVSLGAGRSVELRVAAVIERSLPGRAGEAILVGWSTAREIFGIDGADAFAVRLVPGARPADREAVEGTAREYALEPSSLERVHGAIADALDRVFGLFDGLAVVAVVVAGLGIVNTLAMSVFERTRELGILRALGMTRRRLWRTVLVEAGILGLAGSVLGVATGLGAGLLMVELARGPGGGAWPPAIPWLVIVLAGCFGVLVAVLAAAYPARLASRTSIVAALAHE